jgi:hypothetical protein
MHSTHARTPSLETLQQHTCDAAGWVGRAGRAWESLGVWSLAEFQAVTPSTSHTQHTTTHTQTHVRAQGSTHMLLRCGSVWPDLQPSHIDVWPHAQQQRTAQNQGATWPCDQLRVSLFSKVESLFLKFPPRDCLLALVCRVWGGVPLSKSSQPA